MGRRSPYLFLLGVTSNLAFAAGALIISLRRHCAGLNADVLVYTDGALAGKDAELLEGLGAFLQPFVMVEGAIPESDLRRYSPLAFARFEALRLLESYEKVVWLDVDTAVQDDISPLFEYGPLSLAREDPNFSVSGKSPRARVNLKNDVPRFDPHKPNYNSGVLVATRDLKDPQGLYRLCLGWLKHYAGSFRFADQGFVNMLAQHVQAGSAEQFQELPYERYNAHPRNPEAAKAAIVHGFGPYNIWSDGRLLSVFPEWSRDYARWLALGGSSYTGEVKHRDFCPGGPLELVALAEAGRKTQPAHNKSET